ncbi:hypothetical protein A1C_00910 [Rickettsia akari str. Hartford]|uniref:Uncharacterized protein n=1 Tax=Rickettsia akari (strain Hartford) TaxID=293614 RepID=A8GM87_RICAH|nr:hypothetical protein A1C_00910 [Rickettsia akari str. Hartford]
MRAAVGLRGQSHEIIKFLRLPRRGFTPPRGDGANKNTTRNIKCNKRFII